MFQVGGWEFLVILVVALIVLGPERLPGVARQVGQAIGTMRQMAQSFQTEFEQAVDAAETAARIEDDAPTDVGDDAQAAATSEAGPEADTSDSPLSDDRTDTDVASGDEESAPAEETDDDQSTTSDPFANATFASPIRTSDQEQTVPADVPDEPNVAETSPADQSPDTTRSAAAAEIASLEPDRLEKPKSDDVPMVADPSAPSTDPLTEPTAEPGAA